MNKWKKEIKKWHNKRKPKRRDCQTEEHYLDSMEIWLVEMLFLPIIVDKFEDLLASQRKEMEKKEFVCPRCGSSSIMHIQYH